MMPALQIDDIHTYYGDSYILQGLSLTVSAGETVAVLGRNGVGKTTLIRSIVGFTPATRGRISYAGDTISGLAPDKVMQRGLALVPQGRRIFRSLTVEETLTIAMRERPAGSTRPAWPVERAYDVFPACASDARSAPKPCPVASSRCWSPRVPWSAIRA